MTLPNTYLIAEEASARRRQLHREAELHNLCAVVSTDRRGWPCRARRHFGLALIAIGELLCADERRTARYPSPTATTHLDPI